MSVHTRNFLISRKKHIWHLWLSIQSTRRTVVLDCYGMCSKIFLIRDIKIINMHREIRGSTPGNEMWEFKNIENNK